MKASDHIYIHIPFCDGKCFYCTFYSEMFSEPRADALLKALENEFDLFLKSNPKPEPVTIYIGGGTPSVLSSSQITRLHDIIMNRISTDRLKEWTMEINPGTLDNEKIHAIADTTINRASIGAQSFDDNILQNIGRRHSVEDITNTIESVRGIGISNISIDLIACLPGVDMQSWRTTIQKALEMNLPHLSVYNLAIEEHTRFRKLADSGAIIIPDDSFQLHATDTAETAISSAGYERYEISNYAKPDSRCIHNLSCWQGNDYLGFGPSASSRMSEARWTNSPEIDHYIKSLMHNRTPTRETNILSAKDDITERLVFVFRLIEGVDLDEFCQAHGEEASNFAETWKQTLLRLKEDKLVEKARNRWKLTKRGRSLADFVASELIILDD